MVIGNTVIQTALGKKKRLLIFTVVACFGILYIFNEKLISLGNKYHFTIADTKELLQNLIRNPNVGHREPDIKQHVGYLKVHKTGSTTIQNIFNRYVLHNNLTEMLPSHGNYLSGYSGRPIWHVLPPPSNKTFDMLFNHCTFNEKVFQALLPNDTVYVASVRNPVTRFVSAFCYYRELFAGQKNYYLNKVNGSESELVHNFVQNVQMYDKELLSDTRNRMAGDFGYPTRYFNDLNLFNEYLQHIGKFFDFVLVAERFEESIIYMRRLLGWSLKDVIQIKINSLSKSSNCKTSLSPEEVEIYRHHSPLDFRLYDYFLTKFNETMSKQDDDFFEEVKYYSELSAKVKEFCYSNSQTLITVVTSTWNTEFILTRLDCEYITMSELDFLEVLKKRRRHLWSRFGKNRHSPLEKLAGLNKTLFNKFRI